MGKFLVTGGGGFIGSNIARYLVKDGHYVVILDNFSTGKKENLQDIISDVKLVEGDVCDMKTVLPLVREVDYILHQAALPSVPRSIVDPVLSNYVNVNGTLVLLEAARESNIKRFVYASSSSIYGDSVELPKYEEMQPNPLSPYAVSKMAGEYYCRVFHKVYGLETVSLRYFNVFGPYQDPASQYSAVIPKFITSILSGNSPVIYGDGEQSRDFTYVSNNIEANLAACYNPGVGGEVFNISCGKRTSLNDMVTMINAELGIKIISKNEAPRKGDVKHSQGSVKKAESLLKFSASVEFEEGLKKTIDWYKKQAM